MDAAGVTRAILVPPSWEGDRNDVVLAAAQRYPDRFAVMGRISLEAPESRAEFLPLARTKGMLGLRFTFHTKEQQKLLTGGAADWLWPAAAAAGVPLMVHPPHSLPLIDAIAARYPNLRLVIDHLGLMRPKLDHEAFAHLSGAARLGQAPEHCREGERGHGLFQRALSVPHPARLSAPGVRRLRAEANVLGIRYFAGASPLSADDHSVYRRTRLAWRGRQSLDHGPWPLRMAELARERISKTIAKRVTDIEVNLHSPDDASISATAAAIQI